MTTDRNITIISAVYPPEPHVSARMSFDLANHLAGQGYAITVVCPQPSRPLSADYSRYRNTDKAVENSENGIKVVRLPSFAAPQSRLLPRMRESFSFGREVTKYLAAVQKMPDVLYVNSWPMFAQAFIAQFAQKNGIPVVLQIMDIYPEALTSKLPAVLRSVIHAPLERLDTWIAETTATVVVISDNMRRTYLESRRIPADRIVTIPTWQDDGLFEKRPDRIEACRRYGIPGNLFTFLYLGNIGPVAGVDFLIRAFHEASIAEAQLVIVGDGSAKADCANLAERLHAAHVHFISDPDAANVPLLQSMAHVCLLPMKSGTGMSSIPSKLPAYLFSAKPVLATVDPDSDTAFFVRQADCGWAGDAEDATWLINKMKEVAQLSMEELESIGDRGKLTGLTFFSKSIGVVRLANTIIQATGEKV